MSDIKKLSGSKAVDARKENNIGVSSEDSKLPKLVRALRDFQEASGILNVLREGHLNQEKMSLQLASRTSFDWAHTDMKHVDIPND